MAKLCISNRLFLIAGICLPLACGSVNSMAQDCLGDITRELVATDSCQIVLVSAKDCNGTACNGALILCEEDNGSYSLTMVGDCFE